MVEQSGSERVTARFGAYIDELREFFASRGVHFGSPEDMVGFAESLTLRAPFRDEMGSLVRSIQFREAESLGRGEMLELISVAVGGAEIEVAAQGMPVPVRQVFLFVNEALRRQWTVPPEMVEEGGQPVTAGDILAAATTKEHAEERAMAGRIPEKGYYDETDAPRRTPSGREADADVPESSGILFKAVSMSDDDPEPPEYDEPTLPVSPRRWFVPAAVAAVVVAAGAALYLGKTAGNPAAGTEAVGGTGALQTQSRPLLAGTCAAPSRSGASRAGLEDRSRWAESLLEQKLYEAALPELRQIALADPAYPGINLEESDALLQMKRPEDARDAVDTQIGISECLAKLPSAALDAYCSAEFTPSAVGGCRAQLAHIRQAAELQAALVHLELGHRANPEASVPDPTLTETAPPPPPAIAARTPTLAPAPRPTADVPEPPTVPRVRRPVPLPAATDGDAGQASSARAVPAAKPAALPKQDHKSTGDDALRRGEGTDSAFGAYSKPQD